MKRFFYGLIALLLFYGGSRLYYFLTDDFTMGNITIDFPLEVEKMQGECDLSVIEPILNQKFHYWCKGGQCYVLRSEDRKYVIKFFKYKNLAPRVWLSFIPFFKKWRDESNEHRLKRRKEIFGALKIAFEELKEECGLIHVQLEKNPIFKTLQITDKLGFLHEVDLSQMQFVLQHYAEPLSMDKKEEWLPSLKKLLAKAEEKKIFDNEHCVLPNLALLNGEVIFLDPGRFVRCKEGETSNMQEKLKKIH